MALFCNQNYGSFFSCAFPDGNFGSEMLKTLMQNFRNLRESLIRLDARAHNKKVGSGVGELLVFNDVAATKKNSRGHRMNDPRLILTSKSKNRIHPLMVPADGCELFRCSFLVSDGEALESLGRPPISLSEEAHQSWNEESANQS